MNTQTPNLTRAIAAQLNARPCLQCGDTGDLVAVRADKFNTHEGWKTEVVYYYIPAEARDTKQAVAIGIQDLAGGFFVNPIDPATGHSIQPWKRE